MGQLLGETGPELFQRTGFCDVPWQFIPISNGAMEERLVVDVIVDPLPEESSLASCSAVTWF